MTEPVVFSSLNAKSLASSLTCSAFASAGDGDEEMIAIPSLSVTYTLVHPIAQLWSTCRDGVCDCAARGSFGSLENQQHYEAVCRAASSILTQAPTFLSSRFECRSATECSIPFMAPMVSFATLGCRMHTYYAYVVDGPSLPRLAVTCGPGRSDCQCEVAGTFAVAGVYKAALQLLAAGGTDGGEADEFGHFLPVRFRVAPQQLEVIVANEQQQQQQQSASTCSCNLACTHTGIWKRFHPKNDSSLPSISSSSSAEAASDTAAIRGGSAARCDDGRGMKWANSCESSCCSALDPPNATCLNLANTTLLVLGFSHERTLWFDMMYSTPTLLPRAALTISACTPPCHI